MDPDHAGRITSFLSWLGSKHPDSGLLLVHQGNHPPDLSALSSWQPIETLKLEESP
jgi:hypothetical protein